MPVADPIREYLTREGPSLSSTLAAYLKTALGLSSPAARKRIERSKAENLVSALEHIRFRHNEQFLFLPEQSGTRQFISALMAALEESKSSFRFPLQGILARGGMVPRSLFGCVSGLSIKEDKGLNAESAFGSLKELKLIETVDTESGQCIRLNELISSKHISSRRLSARLSAESIFLFAFRDWLRLQGMVSHEKASIRGIRPAPQFAFFEWDFVAPSYISALTHAGPSVNTQPGFIVADVILGRVLSERDVQPFMTKCASAKGNPGNRPFLAFLIADWFEKDALWLGRKNGLLFTTPRNFFGAAFAEMLDTLIQALEDKESLHSSSRNVWQSIADAGSDIRHLPEAFLLFKSTVFELLVGACASVLYDAKVHYGVRLNDRARTKAVEVDLLLRKPECQIIAIECKLANFVSVESLRQWFLETAPMVRSIYLDDPLYKHCAYEFSFWTSGKFTDEARKFIEELHRNQPEYKVSVFDFDAMRTLLETSGQDKLIRLLDAWYKPLLSKDPNTEDLQSFREAT